VSFRRTCWRRPVLGSMLAEEQLPPPAPQRSGNGTICHRLRMGTTRPSFLLLLRLLHSGGRGRPSLAASAFHALSSCVRSIGTRVWTRRRETGALAWRRLRVYCDCGHDGGGCGGGQSWGWAGIGGRRGGEGRRNGSSPSMARRSLAGGESSEEVARRRDGSGGWPSCAMFLG
jgi:hypothetical protein